MHLHGMRGWESSAGVPSELRAGDADHGSAAYLADSRQRRVLRNVVPADVYVVLSERQPALQQQALSSPACSRETLGCPDAAIPTSSVCAGCRSVAKPGGQAFCLLALAQQAQRAAAAFEGRQS
jgi:hypothetical protein